MAFSEGPIISSFISETTLTTAYLYKLAYLSSDGYVLVPTSLTGFTTGRAQAPIGVCYGVTQTTSTQSEAIPIAIGGIVKLKFSSDSTMVPGDVVCASSAGFGTSASTQNFVIGTLIAFTTGGERHVGSVQWTPVPFRAALRDITSTGNT